MSEARVVYMGIIPTYCYELCMTQRCHIQVDTIGIIAVVDLYIRYNSFLAEVSQSVQRC